MVRFNLNNLIPILSVCVQGARGRGGGGLLLGILGVCVLPGCLNSDSISDQCHYSNPFSDLASKKHCDHYLDYNSKKQKKILKIPLEFAY